MLQVTTASAVLSIVLGTAALPAQAVQYPPTKKVEQVDAYHGQPVPDPYRWLEDDVRTSSDAQRWVEEQNKVTFGYLQSIPFRKGTIYPATLLTTADTDDRVVPGPSFKFAAALQEAQSGPAPVLIRIETKAGHGAGKPTVKIIEEVADQWAFAAQNLGLKLPADFRRPLSAKKDPRSALPPRE